jgi:hypothetical protein
MTGSVAILRLQDRIRHSPEAKNKVNTAQFHPTAKGILNLRTPLTKRSKWVDANHIFSLGMMIILSMKCRAFYL